MGKRLLAVLRILFSIACWGNTPLAQAAVGEQTLTPWQATATSNLLVNGGFESISNGGAPWIMSSTAILASNPSAAHAGSLYAWLGGTNSSRDTIYQDVNISANAVSPVVQFWYWISTEEGPGTIYDTLAVTVQNPTSGATLATLVQLSNLDAASGWVQSAAYDVSAFKGQRVRLRFAVANDGYLYTSFRLDDVSLMAGSPPVTYALAVSKAGTGGGTVVSSPAGISCGATCNATFTSGTSVTLTAGPTAGSVFSGWSGSGCSGTGVCTIAMSAARSVTAAFNPTSSPGLVTRYRLYSPGTFEHLYTTDFNEYSVLPACCAWVPEGAIYQLFAGAATYGGVAAVPYYRLYNPFSYQHHWTTDLGEYNFLATVGWIQEGIDGWILPTQAAGSVPLYRLYLNAAGGLHLWTIDANERNYLTANAGWIDEGIAGYVIPLP